MSNDKLAEALREAAASLRTLERGAMLEEYLDDAYSVRAYARSRADVAENALQAHAAEAARAHSVPGELAEPIEGAFNYEQKLAFTEGWNACRDAMLAAAPQQAAEPVRQFRVVPKGSVWTDVKDPEIWASVIAHPKSYETRVLYTRPQPAQDAALYQELLMAVSKKFPNESRHETALRYIKQTELQSCEPKCDTAMAKESGR